METSVTAYFVPGKKYGPSIRPVISTPWTIAERIVNIP